LIDLKIVVSPLTEGFAADGEGHRIAYGDVRPAITFLIKSAAVLIALSIAAGVVILIVPFEMEGKLMKAPLFTITDIEGVVLRLDEEKGKIVIVEFMATWCKYCKVQAEELKLVFEHFRNSSIKIISISIEPLDDPKTLAKYKDDLEATWIFAQGYEVGLNYSIKAIPTIVIIDYEGKIRFRHEGVVGAPRIIAEISELLNNLKG
jgi:thiol-disulfide isomerase/thioredoxin